MAFFRALCFVLLVGFAAACQPDCSWKCPPKCPPMWTFYNGNCYRYFGTGKTYDEAESHCQEFTEVGLGHLASIASAEENNLLLTMWKSVRTTTTGGLWIGLNDQAEEGNFIWTDGSAVTFTDWATTQPDNYQNEDCAHMRHELDGDDRWNDIACSRAFAYVCKMSTTN
uniref:Alpha-N-acetylgalactosamine-specific lectin n=1 Tax=Patiria pectinifera TaxID=7594 RepID=LECG_PATPE|nr:RecName: Full=Alpha-N-acetylgalactosamine-specific lectin; AltName: Full=Alpha-N-acetylgalactosamine-binding lectin; AltName: Full=GalNAc-specific lectin; AltName: Full=Lectin; Short=ApL; AltName: Full=Tn antigen-specific lectin; Flags: Precursor [Patiria pectinifera]BAB78598.1 GalNAc-specific lectin [Patiria pectinifera]BAB85109.1 alpha-N-acetylgalactosamine-binding lectin [Patiria pectinifera]